MPRRAHRILAAPGPSANLAAMRAVLLFALLLLAACGRPLTEGERALARVTHGDAVDLDRIRFHDGALVGSYVWERPARPRSSCRERIWPPGRPGELVEVSPGAIALFNRVFYRTDLYRPDYAPGFPDRIFLAEAMLFAHELTHIWQWQNRARTGYHPFLAAREHTRSPDPYLFELETADFLSYGYEQQGAIMEEYVCCTVLDPDAPRTERLRRMLAREIPVGDLDAALGEAQVIVPWSGVELRGICSD